jgi:hypothetical protein
MQLICEISKIQTMADHTIQLRLTLNELSPEQMAVIFSLAKNETAYAVEFKEV